MSRCMSNLLFPVFLLGLALLFEPAAAQAEKRFFLQNATRYPISVTLLVPNNSGGWHVDGWWHVAPYSYKKVKFVFANASGRHFGVYAHTRHGGGKVWQGSGNAPNITVISQGFSYDRRYSPPGGTNRRVVKVRMVQGDTYRFLE